MALVYTSDLTGIELDYAVAIIECDSRWLARHYHMMPTMAYSTDPSLAWPIIERERITLAYGLGLKANLWFAEKYQCYGRNTASQAYGKTSLVAAMRSYVGSVLGSQVEIPAEITELAV